MSLISNAALRVTAGALILNSGIGKLGMDEGTATHLHNMAKTGVPQVEALDAKTFGKALSYTETALGAALLCPLVSPRIAGLGLAGFGAGLLTMYFGNEEMTQEDGIRPTHEGTSLAKDALLVGAGLALVFSRKGL